MFVSWKGWERGGVDLAPVSSSSVHLPSLAQLHTLRATGFTFTAAVLRDGISDLAHFEFAGDWEKKKKRDGVLLPLLIPLLPFFLPFFPFLPPCFICLTARPHAPWLRAEQLLMSRLVEFGLRMEKKAFFFSTVGFYENTQHR